MTSSNTACLPAHLHHCCSVGTSWVCCITRACQGTAGRPPGGAHRQAARCAGLRRRRVADERAGCGDRRAQVDPALWPPRGARRRAAMRRCACGRRYQSGADRRGACSLARPAACSHLQGWQSRGRRTACACACGRAPLARRWCVSSLVFRPLSNTGHAPLTAPSHACAAAALYTDPNPDHDPVLERGRAPTDPRQPCHRRA